MRVSVLTVALLEVGQSLSRHWAALNTKFSAFFNPPSISRQSIVSLSSLFSWCWISDQSNVLNLCPSLASWATTNLSLGCELSRIQLYLHLAWRLTRPCLELFARKHSQLQHQNIVQNGRIFEKSYTLAWSECEKLYKISECMRGISL